MELDMDKRNINCPFCGNEMEFGYVQSGDPITWRKTPAAFGGFAWLTGEVLTLDNSAYSGSLIEANRCKNCKIVMFSYQTGYPYYHVENETTID